MGIGERDLCKGLGKGSQRDARLLHYGDSFVYKYQKVTNETVGDLITAIIEDVKILVNNKFYKIIVNKASQGNQ